MPDAGTQEASAPEIILRCLAQAAGGRSRAWVVDAKAMDAGPGAGELSRVTFGGEVDVASVLAALGLTGVVRPLGGVPLGVCDLRRLRRARDAGGASTEGPLVADVSLTSQLGCPSGRLGADVSVSSLDAVVGREGSGLVLVTLRREALQGRLGCGGLADRVSGLAAEAPPSDGAWGELSRGLGDFDCRRRKANDVAQVLACYLSCHPAVTDLRYPGVQTDPAYEAGAACLQDGFGPRVDFRGSGSAAAGRKTRDLCGTWAPGGRASRLLERDDGWHSLYCGTGDARELVMGLEPLLDVR